MWTAVLCRATEKAPTTRAASQILGPITVNGLLHLQEKPGWFTSNNDAAHNFWFYVGIPALAKAADVGRVLPIYLGADATHDPGGWPFGGQTINGTAQPPPAIY